MGILRTWHFRYGLVEVCESIGGSPRWLNWWRRRTFVYPIRVFVSKKCWQVPLSSPIHPTGHIYLVVSNICLFSSLPGGMIQFDSYFSNGLKPPTRYDLLPQRLICTIGPTSETCNARALLDWNVRGSPAPPWKISACDGDNSFYKAWN